MALNVNLFRNSKQGYNDFRSAEEVMCKTTLSRKEFERQRAKEKDNQSSAASDGYGRLYVTHMLRWGDRENHSYVLGVYSSLELAKQEGVKERDYRANKYLPSITSHSLDNILIANEEGFWINDDEQGEGEVIAEQLDMKSDDWVCS